jgi:hypothetical protein
MATAWGIPMDRDDVISTLNDLIETSKDGDVLRGEGGALP